MSTQPVTSKTTTAKANLDDAEGERRQTCLRDELEDRIKWFDQQSKSHKKLFRRLRHIVFGLTAFSSALAGLALAFPRIQTEITVVIILATAATGVATSVEGLRKPNELWIHERTIYYSLLDLQRELNYYASGPTDPKPIDAYFVRLQSILGSSQDKWSRDIAAAVTALARQDNASPAGLPAHPGADSK
jgi:hypothetical protein